ncbi:glycine betaine ABC transporter substrate-binding protein [Anabaena sp. CS-542/02]|uniref:glycine betaine ABC transporter substrate-binding protein n=1 Tax=Anabaena sp. CS-542/02 TaxID=3021719 RepID=UPI00232D4557|nr:glycine betaine ABC transporter substrate-binding protein [Anabaena sp. CS-542/02]MDB9448154.1 glycine betaine ABC transporter substrate-binding protein [Anabaena sp. CS-542/02]
MKRLLLLSVLTCLMLVAIASCNFNSTPRDTGDIVVASKNFTEQDILGELLAQQIEEHTDLTVTRRPRLGGTFVCHNALLAGQIDAYIEYTGTAFNAILKEKVVHDPKLVSEKLTQAYAQQFNLEVMPSLGFENNYAIIVRVEDAQRYNLQTISDAVKYTPKWRGGFGYEFLEREDGFPGFAKTYGIEFARPPQIMDLGLIYRALTQKQVDMVAGNSTDGQISRLGLVVLKDDKQYFPHYEAVPIVRKETLQKYPQLRAAINQLTGKITEQEIRQLNNLVEGELQDIKTVVSEFRKSKQL